MKVTTVIYVRVSTNEQTKGYSLPTQIKGCQEYAVRHDLDVVEVIKDNISGATRLDERDGGKRLLEVVQSGFVQAVVVWRLDRLSRPPENEYSRLLTTIEQFAKYQVQVHDCEMGEVKNDMASIMIAFFKGLAASQERAAIRERSMRGIDEKGKQGRYVGQGAPPFGYIKIGRNREARLEIHPERAELVRRIFYLYTDNQNDPLTFKQIAVLLTSEGILTPGQVKKGGRTGRGGWYPTTIKNIITNENYIGRFKWSGHTHERTNLAIVEQPIWEAAQGRRALNQKYSKRNQRRSYLLAGHIRCRCGGALTGESKKRRKDGYNVYYRCKKVRYEHIEYCPVRHIRADIVEAVVWDWLVELLTSPENLEAGLKTMAKMSQTTARPMQERLDVVEELLVKAKRSITRLVTTFADTDDEIVATALASKIGEKKQLRQSLEKERDGLLLRLDQAEYTPALRDVIIEMAQAVSQELPDCSFEKKRRLLDTLNVQVQLLDKQKDVHEVQVKCFLLPKGRRIKYRGRRFESGRPDKGLFCLNEPSSAFLCRII